MLGALTRFFEHATRRRFAAIRLCHDYEYAHYAAAMFTRCRDARYAIFELLMLLMPCDMARQRAV